VKIGINAVGLLPGVIGGGETYIRGLVGGLSRLRCHDQFVLFTNRENHPTFGGLGPNFRRIRFNFSARWTIPSLAMTRVVGEQFLLPWRAAREGLDVIHSPLDTVPLMARCATVMTLHDANFDALPEAARRADAETVRGVTGYAIGGVPPIGFPTRLLTFIDLDLTRYETIWAAAGTPRHVFETTPDDLVRVTSGTVGELKLES